MPFTNQTKNTSIFQRIIAHGRATLLSDIADFTFNDVVFPDGTQLKDVRFDQLVDAVWAKQSKNVATFTNQTKN